MADKPEMMAATPVMGSVGLSWLDLKSYAQHLIHILQTEGNTAIDAVDTAIRLVKAVTNRDYVTVFAALQQEQKDIQQIIEAIRTEFGLN